MITPSPNNIWFYWDGPISERRLEILLNCVYSARIFNPYRPIYVISNSLKQSQFDDKFEIIVSPWDQTFFEGVPVSQNIIDAYVKADPRSFSDFFRLVLLYKFGGSYIDTDDVSIAPITSFKKNVICRSTDPHTCFYNKIEDQDCIPGKYREIRGYDEIPFFPRNDCWLNFNSHHPIIGKIFTHPLFVTSEKHPFYIIGDISFQSLILSVMKENISDIGVKFNIGLNLLCLYEDFMSKSSPWDYKESNGEQHDLYATLPHIDEYEWGSYKCTQETALQFLFIVLNQYPTLSHLWLYNKENEPEWFLQLDNPDQLCYISTWIYDHIKQKIKNYEI